MRGSLLLGGYLCPRLCRPSLAPTLLFGLLSVFSWYWFDDLRLYARVQFFPILAILLVALQPRRRFAGDGFLIVPLVCYLLAKIAENYDHEVIGMTRGFVSGHTLKHLPAAVAALAVLLMQQRRSADQHWQQG